MHPGKIEQLHVALPSFVWNDWWGKSMSSINRTQRPPPILPRTVSLEQFGLVIIPMNCQICEISTIVLIIPPFCHIFCDSLNQSGLKCKFCLTFCLYLQKYWLCKSHLTHTVCCNVIEVVSCHIRICQCVPIFIWFRPCFSIEQAHEQQVRDIDFNPNKIYHFATCGDDCQVHYWDSRKTKEPLMIRRDHSHWYGSTWYTSRSCDYTLIIICLQ